MGVLYPSSSSLLLPHLKASLPLSLPVYSTILANHSISTTLELYATFPPETPPPSIWVAIVSLPDPSNQCRLFCSLESALFSLSLQQPNNVDDSTRAKAQDLVNAASLEILKLHPRIERLGCVNEIWTKGLRKALNSPCRESCSIFLAPKDSSTMDTTDVIREGWYLDIGRSGDEHSVYKTSTLRSLEYYAACLPRTTVIRPDPLTTTTTTTTTANTNTSTPSPPISFILTHADGSLGALYTDPKYRRKGLAKWVTAERLKKYREEIGNQVRGWAVVFIGNSPSEQLWSSMGWEKAWTVSWVYK